MVGTGVNHLVMGKLATTVLLSLAAGDGRAYRVALFGSLNTPGAEASGIYFSTGPGTLFVNVQHSDANDMTLSVTRQ
jgi:secreted PhoX family phosphatase